MERKYFRQLSPNLKNRVVLCRLAAEATGMERGTWPVGWGQDPRGLDQASSGAEGQAGHPACREAEFKPTTENNQSWTPPPLAWLRF